MTKIERQPSPEDLRVFGLILPFFFILIGLISYWSVGPQRFAFGTWAAGGAISLAYYFFPGVRRRLYVAWMVAVYPISWLVLHAVLGVTYYCLMTPIGLVMRLFGRDPMSRLKLGNRKSYWLRRDVAETGQYFRQF